MDRLEGTMNGATQAQRDRKKTFLLLIYLFIFVSIFILDGGSGQ